MRLVMLTSDFPRTPDTPTGGVASAVSCLVYALKEQRPEMEIHVVHLGVESTAAPISVGGSQFTYHAVAQSRLTTYSPSAALIQRLTLPLLKHIDPHVVHVQNQGSLMDPRSFPSVLTVHGILERDTYYRARRFRRLRTALLANREAPPRARYRHLIAIASYVVQQIPEQDRGRAHLIPNPAEDQFFDNENRASDSPPIILQVGGVIPRKNARATIQAVGILKRRGIDCQLRLAGPRSDGPYAAELDALVSRLGLDDRIRFLGAVPHSRLREHLANTRLLALPSFQETAPVVIAEANAMGVPAVVSPAGGCSEMVSDEYTGRVADPRFPESLADAMQDLLENPELASIYGTRARERAERYRASRVAQATLKVYDLAIAERGA